MFYNIISHNNTNQFNREQEKHIYVLENKIKKKIYFVS